jgi:single-stranded-DNA-specific exonuclease
MTLKPLEEIGESVEKELGAYSTIMRRLLVNRNITTRDEAYRFLVPSYDEHLFDSFLLKDIEKAIDRIKHAIDTGEKILVYADYDCDGIPGAVIMHDFFAMLSYANFEIYIPDRHKEGYGLQKESLERIFEKEKPGLIVTVDLGITNVGEVLFCQNEGVDVIVTDHHLPGKEIPLAFAVVNPKQEACSYPDEMLCGSGVAFKLIQAFLKKYGTDFSVALGQEKWLLDMVGLATLSDMVPLVKENRVFAYYGLLVFRKTKRPGLQKLLKKAGLRTDVLTEDDITFMISPRINAAGRMDHPKHAFELLSTKDMMHAEEKSKLLHEYNLTRKNLVKNIIKKAKSIVEHRKNHSVIVVGDRTWAPGILGLVASRLVEEYKKPVFVWGGGEDELIMKGSCRSDGSINMVEYMQSVSEEFVTFGGHELAGGFAVHFDKVHFLQEALETTYDRLKKDVVQAEYYTYDTELSFDDVTEELYADISKLAPFGVGNPKPIFLFRDSVVYDVRVFGKQNEHLELTFRTQTGRFIKAIAFFTKHDDFSEPLVRGMKIQLFASLEKSYFGYKAELRRRIEDIHIS